MDSNIQRFNIEINGQLKEAEVLKIISIDNREYVIYSVKKNDKNGYCIYSNKQRL